MSAALTGGLFTRTPAQLVVERERAGIHATLDAVAGNGASTLATLAALRRCTDACDSDDDLTALRVLSQHAALHGGVLVSAPLQAKLAQLRAQCSVD